MEDQEAPIIPLEIPINKMNLLDKIDELYVSEINRIYQSVLERVDLTDACLRSTLIKNNVDLSNIR